MIDIDYLVTIILVLPFYITGVLGMIWLSVEICKDLRMSFIRWKVRKK